MLALLNPPKSEYGNGDAKEEDAGDDDDVCKADDGAIGDGEWNDDVCNGDVVGAANGDGDEDAGKDDDVENDEEDAGKDDDEKDDCSIKGDAKPFGFAGSAKVNCSLAKRSLEEKLSA
jgi:hypothetical protein